MDSGNMLTLIYGGSGCGKSEFAEKLAVHAAYKNGAAPIYYIATMQPFDAESQCRIERHRRMRARKNFRTVECYTHIERLSIPKGAIVLLECLSNLTANEMFSKAVEIENPLMPLENRIFNGLSKLCIDTELILVTNNIFEDGIQYGKETVLYQHLLASLNQRLAEKADKIYEIVAGIPITVQQLYSRSMKSAVSIV